MSRRFRLTDNLEVFIERAIEAHGMGEPIVWDVVIAPGPQPQAGPIAMVVLYLPNGLINQYVHAQVPVINPVAVTEGEMDQIISNALTQMREARSQFLASQAPTNGKTGPGGIVLPGG